MKKRSILIVDDHPIVSQGLAQLINEEEDLQVEGTCTNPEEALSYVVKQRPDIAVVDLNLDGCSGMKLIQDILATVNPPPVLVLSMHEEIVYTDRALRAGACGYVMKSEATDRIVEALRTVLSGKTYLSESVRQRMDEYAKDDRPETDETLINDLTNRELEVFDLIGKGLGTREIAESLSLSMKTIETYREHIKAKLHLKNARELVQRAIDWARTNTKRQPEH